MLGGASSPDDFPLLLDTHSEAIQFESLSMMLPLDSQRIWFGALIAPLAVPLYLVSALHIHGAFQARSPRLAMALSFILLIGFAWTPLAHAGFYFAGETFRGVLAAPTDAQGLLIELGNRFANFFGVFWMGSLLAASLAWTGVAVGVALGRSDYPRWAALLLNPVTLLAIAIGLPLALPRDLAVLVEGAAFNIALLLAFLVSTVLLWRSAEERAERAGA